ncbi:unnamed protein product [Caenorhabditis nigoni]
MNRNAWVVEANAWLVEKMQYKHLRNQRSQSWLSKQLNTCKCCVLKRLYTEISNLETSPSRIPTTRLTIHRVIMKFRGILLDINDNYVLLFNCENYREIRLWNTYQNVANRDDISIGNVYQFRDERILRRRKNDMEELVDVKVRNGDVFLKTFALTPSTNVQESPYSTAPVSDKVYQRYRGCVYSPQLGMLEDPDNIVRNIRGYNEGEYALVRVEYYPSDENDEKVFRVVKGYSRAEYLGPERVSPWHQEENGDDVYNERAMEIRRVASRNNTFRIRRAEIFNPSICVAVRVPNPEYNPDNDGSTPLCNMLYNIELGIIRCTQRARLGCWYQHVVNDHRKHKLSMRRHRRRLTFSSVTATQLQRILGPIRARDDGEEVELPVSFRFDRQMFEREEDHSLPRDQRRIKADAHFWNETIGKVDIPQGVALQIVQKADDIRDRTRRRTIIVKVYVKLVNDYIDRAQMVKNPMVAFFKVDHVRGFYDKKDRVIQDV